MGETTEAEEDYFISRLESPCSYCEDDLHSSYQEEEMFCCNLEETWITISNPKDGKMLGIETVCLNKEISQLGERSDLDLVFLEMMEPTLDLEMTWTYKPTCDGKVTLINNIGAPGNVLNVTYDANLKTMMNEDRLFALNSKKGFKWVSELKYLKAEPGTPWLRYQWDVLRVPMAGRR